jgi:uncharacterized protein
MEDVGKWIAKKEVVARTGLTARPLERKVKRGELRRKTRRSLIVVMFLCTSAPFLWAEDQAAFFESVKKGAAQGEVKAQTTLGVMYDKGKGVPQDYPEALKWYRLAATQGDALAQYNLGVMYDMGKGVPQDYAEALKWYRLAAAQGDAEAQTNLGVMYAQGKGVLQDYVQAHKWFTLAAVTFTTPSERDQAAQARDRVAAKMTPAQIAEAQKLAREWKKQ